MREVSLSITYSDILITIFKVVDELNKLSPPEAQLSKEATAVLLGESGVLDSLGLINLIVMVEEKVQSDLKAEVIILDEEALVNLEGPYQTIDTLATWILARIG